jgi:hypothetical protein
MMDEILEDTVLVVLGSDHDRAAWFIFIELFSLLYCVCKVSAVGRYLHNIKNIDTE